MKFKLPKKVKDKWVKALRSGNYKQGRHDLHNEISNTYCCLGVARECGLGKKRAGIELLTETFMPIEIQEKLAGMNDKIKLVGNEYVNANSFNKIAAWIERYL